MNSMLPVIRTILFEFQFFLEVAPVFAGGIIAPFALGTLQGNQFHRSFLTRHL
jgi:hypothetical protein